MAENLDEYFRMVADMTFEEKEFCVKAVEKMVDFHLDHLPPSRKWFRLDFDPAGEPESSAVGVEEREELWTGQARPA
jgi:hypothetical protein